MHDLILFDLDGTISDPLEGIARSLNYALVHFGYEPRELPELAQYVGPPLDLAFKDLTGSDKNVEGLIAQYRDRYSQIGYAENVLYPGIPEVLQTLHAANIPMGLCTSKRRDFAEQILEMFELSHYFQFISGGEIGIQKYQQIEALIEQERVSQSSVMIGDRAIDIIAAHKNGLTAGGVLWGYGSQAELANEHPNYLFSSPSQLKQLAH